MTYLLLQVTSHTDVPTLEVGLFANLSKRLPIMRTKNMSRIFSLKYVCVFLYFHSMPYSSSYRSVGVL